MTPADLGRDLDVAGLLALLRSPAAADHDGEAVTVAQHSLQCAMLLRQRIPDDEELHVAGLVHDLGTVLEPDRPATHAATGAAAVRAVLGDRVARLVAQHDRAKRYLVSTDREYRARLSDRSIETLTAQGGPMDVDACAIFASSRDFASCIELRRADDDAKVPGRDVGDVDDWRQVIERVARVRSPGPVDG